MKKLVVAEVISGLGARCGAETFFVGLVNEMGKRSDVELHVVSLYDALDPSFEPLRRNPLFSFHTLGKHRGIDIKAAWKLRKLIRKIKPDIVHGHLGYLTTYWLAFGRRAQPFQLVHTCHSVKEPYDKLKRYFSRANRIHLVCLSESVKKLIASQYPKSEVDVVYNGIELPILSEPAEKTYDFICVAAFRYPKNHHLLVDAFDFCWRRDNTRRLICVGGGSLLPEVMEYAKSKPCFSNIVFAGPQSDVYRYLAQSKVFVLPSEYEGTPVSILEAMHCGLPIVASKVGGIPDLVKEGVNGFLCSENDPSSFSECMEKGRLAYEEGHVSERNRAGVQIYSVSTCCQNYLELFSRYMGH